MTSTHAISGNVAQLRESATIAVSQRARALKAEGRQIIDLGAGEPDFDTPAFIKRAAQRAIDEGATKYTAVEGILPLRQAIADIANEHNRCEKVTPSDVVVTTGSKQALFNACFALFGEDDEVLIPTPAWTSYYEMVNLARASAIEVRAAASNGFKVTADDLERYATDETRGSFRSYGVSGTPSFVLVDGKGVVQAHTTGYSNKKGLQIDGWKWDAPSVAADGEHEHVPGSAAP